MAAGHLVHFTSDAAIWSSDVAYFTILMLLRVVRDFWINRIFKHNLAALGLDDWLVVVVICSGLNLATIVHNVVVGAH